VHAIAAMEVGLCDVALITYGSTQRLDGSRRISGLNADSRTPNGQFVQPYGMISPIGFYAMQAQLHRHRHGTTEEDLGEVALAARKWAQRNPHAVAQEDLTMAAYLASPMICEPLRKLDICRVTDGAGAMVVTRQDRAQDLNKRPVNVLGFGERYRHHLTPFSGDDWLDNGMVPEIADEAFSMAQLDRKDIDLVQIYDAFTIGVLIGLEELGFCRQGEAGDLVRGGRIAPGGNFPVNTSGGGLSFNHPGMFGMQLAIESVRQLRGEAGDRQVSDPRTCVMHAGGLVMSAHIVMILGTD
jgi:acetyl-CoA C-acetyltransferase